VVQGIYPSGNFCEHHQGKIKGTKDKAGIIDLHVSMRSFVANQAPKLIEHERTQTSHIVAGCRVFLVKPICTAVAIFHCMQLGVNWILTRRPSRLAGLATEPTLLASL
jgi:hypothetical protein